MSLIHGIRRKPFQVVTSGEYLGRRVTCVQIDDEGDEEWLERTYKKWRGRDQDLPLPKRDLWQYVLVLPWASVRLYWASNDGMQAWREIVTGYTMPDYCRQTGGCPEMWNSHQVRSKKELEISNLNEIAEFVVWDHAAVGPYPNLLQMKNF